MDPDTANPYDVLKLSPTASQAAITAAYRRLAKILHPDVPKTGDEAAFIHLQQAYRVLSDPQRRAAHDQARRGNTRPAWRSSETELSFTRAVAWRWPRLVVPALAVVTVLALAQVGAMLMRPAPTPGMAPRVTAPAAVSPPLPQAATIDVAPSADFADADHYIAPGPPLPWRTGAGPGRLDAFTPVALVGTAGPDGRADIRTRTGATGAIDAARLLPGDARAARLAACLHHAGAPPRPGQVLHHRASGPARLDIANAEDRPAVFKLRDAAGAVLAAVYVAPRGRAVLENLPAGPHRAEYALGDLWSAACGLFTAGMRAQVLDAPVALTAAAHLAIPAPASTDITDQEFARD